MNQLDNLLTIPANELREILSRKFGIELTEQEAQTEAKALLDLFYILLTKSSVTGYNLDKEYSDKDLSGREVPKID